MQKALTRAYEKKILRDRKLMAVKRLIDRRRQYGRRFPSKYPKRQTALTILGTNQLPQFVTMLQKEIAPGSATPINRGTLMAGKDILVSGIGFGERHDSFVLTAFVDLVNEGRGVTIPLSAARSKTRSNGSQSSWKRKARG
ncbi:hypothetical protein [Hyphomicrobium sp. MC1]|uniref:hypothetical protein n=1 Tax=Hyphomicrobium sp. (strain MC1) TaxID=717785 RepID=UPI000213D837|nr:hypothetical protein [Hyphomicrobium sp. MC1]CCB65073.1 protein of unknown function [Hyphomicrobium sp. MC1]